MEADKLVEDQEQDGAEYETKQEAEEEDQTDQTSDAEHDVRVESLEQPILEELEAHLQMDLAVAGGRVTIAVTIAESRLCDGERLLKDET